jgi:hypothetical protein
MEGVEKFLKEQFIPKVVEDKQGIKCLFQHKDKLVEDGVVFFEFAKKKWSKKPIMSNRQFVIVDADMTDVLTFLNSYYNLTEDDFSKVRKVIIDMGVEQVDKFFGNDI